MGLEICCGMAVKRMLGVSGEDEGTVNIETVTLIVKGKENLPYCVLNIQN
jgi:hypothetical protein